MALIDLESCMYEYMLYLAHWIERIPHTGARETTRWLVHLLFTMRYQTVYNQYVNISWGELHRSLELIAPYFDGIITSDGMALLLRQLGDMKSKGWQIWVWHIHKHPPKYNITKNRKLLGESYSWCNHEQKWTGHWQHPNHMISPRR